jgi:GNAT superfamily N-acetyltransferase
MEFTLRTATLADRAKLEGLIARSIRQLGAGDYSTAQIEAALKGAFGVDTQLIADGTYFVVEAQGCLVGCGGWSYRRTLFGGDTQARRDAGELDPAVDAARIRAFFVDPQAARSGIGRALLAHCEEAAVRRGFHSFELMATLPGVRLYAACGYVAQVEVQHPLTAEIAIRFLQMKKAMQGGSQLFGGEAI